MTSIQEIAKLANEIADRNAFEVPWNRPSDGNYAYKVTVHATEDSVVLTARVTFRVREQQAKEVLAKVWAELVERLGDDAKACRVVRSGGAKVWRKGYWNMGRFCTDALARGLRVAAA